MPTPSQNRTPTSGASKIAPTAPEPSSEPTSDETLASLAKALSHPARIRIVRTLLERQSCIGCELTDELGLAASTTSEHLRILKEAGLIRGEIERPRVCYSLSPHAIAPLAELLEAIASHHPQPEPNSRPNSRKV